MSWWLPAVWALSGKAMEEIYDNKARERGRSFSAVFFCKNKGIRYSTWVPIQAKISQIRMIISGLQCCILLMQDKSKMLCCNSILLLLLEAENEELLYCSIISRKYY